MTVCLIHHPLEKMAAVFASDISKNIFLNENDIITVQFSLKIVLRNTVVNKPALV